LNEYIEKQTLDWNLQVAGTRGRPKQTWNRALFGRSEKAGICGRIWSKVKRLLGNRVRWRCSTNVLSS